MGLRINTNVQSLISQHRLQTSHEELEHTQQKLASGSQIVRAMDDAAGLAISENLRNTMRSTDQNIKNANNGFFMLETAENALNEVTNVIIRMKELAVSAASDTNGDKERMHLNNEYVQLKSEVDRIARTTLFNGRPLLDGSGGDISVQVGPNNNELLDRITVPAHFDARLEALGLSDFHIDTSDGARESLEPMETALTNIATVRGLLGASESRLNATVSSLSHFQENTTDAFSRIRDADMAKETSEYAKLNILNQAGVAILAQANSAPGMVLKLLQN